MYGPAGWAHTAGLPPKLAPPLVKMKPLGKLAKDRIAASKEKLANRGLQRDQDAIKKRYSRGLG